MNGLIRYPNFSKGEKMNKLFSNKKQEKGQGLVEYAIILALIAIVAIGVMTTLGKKVSSTFDRVNTALDSGAGSPNWAQICVGNSGLTFNFHQTSNGGWSYGTDLMTEDTGSYTCP
jgi:pilus assembly protein Flp/PilA